jgi:replicative DNA helicase
MNFANESTRIAEQSVIGAILLDEKILASVIDIVGPENFYYSDLKASYQAILSLSSQGKPIDFVTVLNELLKEQKFEQNAMKSALFECVQVTPAISNAPRYAKIVADSHKARKLQNIASQLAFGDVNAENADQILENTMCKLFEISKQQNDKKMRDISSIGNQILEDYRSGKNLENRSDTGFVRLDNILKGMSAGNLIVLAARPKVGKTAFALKIAENVAKTGKKVLFFSLEMQGAELFERILSENAKIPMNSLIDRHFGDQTRTEKERKDELDLIEKNMQKLAKLPIKIHDSPAITVNKIRLESRMIAGLGLIVVDYLQLMRSPKRHENRNQEVGAICRDLKCLAAELGVPILCLSQLNRNSDETQRPTPAELRDSGEIEQSANKLIMLWCAEKKLNNKGELRSKIIGADVALNRRGNTGVTLFNFDGNFMQFSELDKTYEGKKSGNSWKLRV